MRLERSALKRAYQKIHDVVQSSIGLEKALFESYADEFIQLVCREGGPVPPKPKNRNTEKEGGGPEEPDYTQPGKWGTRRHNVGKLFVWQDHLAQPFWLEISILSVPPTCEDYVIEAWYGEFSGQCPPAGGFLPLVQKAQAKAVAEALTSELRIPHFDSVMWSLTGRYQS